MKVERVILNEKDTLRRLVEALDNNLTFEDNISAVRMEVITPVTIDQEFVVHHMLGRVPFTFIASVDRPAIVYGSRRELWDRDSMYLRSTASNATVYLTVL